MANSTEREPPAPFEHISVATDFSAGAASAVARAARLPLAEGGKVTVTHVLSDRIPQKARADAEKFARRHLEQVRKSVSKAAVALGRRDIRVSSEPRARHQET
jgi:nucleotide-binding universal stress UspA family protein